MNCGEKSCIAPYTSARKSKISKINSYFWFFLGLLHPAFPHLLPSVFAPEAAEQYSCPLDHPLKDIQEAELVLDTTGAWQGLSYWEKATNYM